MTQILYSERRTMYSKFNLLSILNYSILRRDQESKIILISFGFSIRVSYYQFNSLMDFPDKTNKQDDFILVRIIRFIFTVIFIEYIDQIYWLIIEYKPCRIQLNANIYIKSQAIALTHAYLNRYREKHSVFVLCWENNI